MKPSPQSPTGLGRQFLLVLTALSLMAGCAKSGDSTGKQSVKRTTITLVTHDSFAVSKPVLAAFEKRTGISVRVVQSGDAGSALNQVILTKENPLGDVFFGVDNTMITRAHDAELFEVYQPNLDKVPKEFQLDKTGRLTPIDHGHVCVNYDKKAFRGQKPPTRFEDLVDPSLKGKLVVENPATSSPGFAFLMATIAHFGDEWPDYWAQLRANDVEIVDGWEQAYNSGFSAGPGKGSRPLVVSYGSSPPAEVYFAKPQPKTAPTGVITATCFRQIEFAGVLAGTSHRKEARRLIDFMLSTEFQNDIPLNMFVYPVSSSAQLPPVFEKHAVIPQHPLKMSPGEIESNRQQWLEQWNKTVLQ